VSADKGIVAVPCYCRTFLVWRWFLDVASGVSELLALIPDVRMYGTVLMRRSLALICVYLGKRARGSSHSSVYAHASTNPAAFNADRAIAHLESTLFCRGSVLSFRV